MVVVVGVVETAQLAWVGVVEANIEHPPLPIPQMRISRLPSVAEEREASSMVQPVRLVPSRLRSSLIRVPGATEVRLSLRLAAQAAREPLDMMAVRRARREPTHPLLAAVVRLDRMESAEWVEQVTSAAAYRELAAVVVQGVALRVPSLPAIAVQEGRVALTSLHPRPAE